MPCKSCGSDNQNKFDAEINIHFPGLKGMNLPAIARTRTPSGFPSFV